MKTFNEKFHEILGIKESTVYYGLAVLNGVSAVGNSSLVVYHQIIEELPDLGVFPYIFSVLSPVLTYLTYKWAKGAERLEQRLEQIVKDSGGIAIE